MLQNREILKKRLDKALFGLWFYERYSQKTPTDNMTIRMCDEYRKQCTELMSEYAKTCSQEYAGNYVWQDCSWLK